MPGRVHCMTRRAACPQAGSALTPVFRRVSRRPHHAASLPEIASLVVAKPVCRFSLRVAKKPSGQLRNPSSGQFVVGTNAERRVCGLGCAMLRSIATRSNLLPRVVVPLNRRPPVQVCTRRWSSPLVRYVPPFFYVVIFRRELQRCTD